MYDLQNFGLHDMIDAGRKLRQPDRRHGSMEQAACAAVDFFYEEFRAEKSADGLPNCVLARCFKTQVFDELPSYLKQSAAACLPNRSASAAMQCLVLLATRGECAHWNSRLNSVAHGVIPLPTVEMVTQAPMIAHLFLQLGLTLDHVVLPMPRGKDESFGVFHVESALGSESVPEQELFVRPYGIKSVLGFGGLLPAGELFAIILFTRVRISAETADLFRTLALGVKLALLPFSGKQVFTEH